MLIKHQIQFIICRLFHQENIEHCWRASHRHDSQLGLHGHFSIAEKTFILDSADL